jgi:prepilin-type N-terminal cleavage/methylation domain-containing protein
MTLKKSQKAFTLVETLFVIGIFSILAILILPLSLDFYRKYQIDVFSQELLQNLRRAQVKSMSIEQDSKFGVYLTNNSYVLFKGNSSSTRDIRYDEVFNLPQVILMSGMEEIVFSKFEGIPSATGSIILSNTKENKIISINEVGRINLE